MSKKSRKIIESVKAKSSTLDKTDKDKGSEVESTDAGATSGIHLSPADNLHKEDSDDFDDMDFDESLFMRKFNRMITKIYEDEEMKDYDVPQVMDINDASLDKDGNLKLAITLQYDDGTVKDSSITINGFTGDSGTYTLTPSDDIIDVDDGEIQADVDADDKNESFKVTGLNYDIDIKTTKKVNRSRGIREQLIITKVGHI